MTQYNQSNFFINLIRKNPEMKEYFKELIPEWIPTTQPGYKKILFEMAYSGEPAPAKKINGKISPLWNAARCYKNELVKIRPDWFPNEFKKTIKEQIFDLAKSGGRKTGYYLNGKKNPLTEASSRYKKELIKIRPDWYPYEFKKSPKEVVFDLAKSGDERPPHKINGIRNPLYDASDTYKKELIKIRPDWYTRDLLKKQIFDLAKSDGERPSYKINGIRNPLYDASDTYKKELIKIRPDWYTNTNEYPKSKGLIKKRIFELVNLGGARPPHKINGVKNPLYYASATYKKELIKIRPDWYRS